MIVETSSRVPLTKYILNGLCYGETTSYERVLFPFSFSVFDQLDLVTYEEVIKLDYFKRKTLVLLGKLDD